MFLSSRLDNVRIFATAKVLTRVLTGSPAVAQTRTLTTCTPDA